MRLHYKMQKKEKTPFCDGGDYNDKFAIILIS